MTGRGTDSGLVVDRVWRTFGAQHAVRGVSFTVAPGELVALVGASGSGKTTTLRIVAGYEIPDSGNVRFDGSDITALPPARRDFGMVFQHYALFPHMSVLDNVAFGLEARGVARAERVRRARAVLDSVGLGARGERGIQQLSGGEQQRVALARAMVFGPRLLLLDEPLSNLDPTLRQSTREELRSVLRQTGAPALFVTHDQDDAFAIADRIVLLAHGEVLQMGSPEDLYERPESRAVASFIGHAVLLPVHLERDGTAVASAGGVRLGMATPSRGSEGDAWAVIRPENVVLDPAGSSGDGAWPGTVVERRFAGAAYAYRVRIADTVVLEARSETRFEEGTATTVRLRRPPPVVTR